MAGAFLRRLVLCAVCCAVVCECRCLNVSSTWISHKMRPVLLEVGDWETSRLSSHLYAILLRDVMNAEVVMEERGGTRMERYERLASGEAHINLEMWVENLEGDVHYFIENRQLVDLGNLGYKGMTGWFMPKSVLSVFPLAEFWRSFQYKDTLSLFPPANSLNATMRDGDYVCSAAHGYPHCTNGRYYPPQCRGDNVKYCIDVVLMEPHWSVMVNERLVDGLGLNFTLVYMGFQETLELFRAYHAQGKAVLFFYWTPERLFAEFELRKLMIPQYSLEQYAAFANDPSLPLSSERPVTLMLKLASNDLDPYAEQLGRAFRIYEGDILEMLALSLDRSHEDAACMWARNHPDRWRQWLPHKAPAGWRCDVGSYGAGDGCHCGCGRPDPDCEDVAQRIVGCVAGVTTCSRECGLCGNDTSCIGCDGVPFSGREAGPCGCEPCAPEERRQFAAVVVLFVIVLLLFCFCVFCVFFVYARRQRDNMQRSHRKHRDEIKRMEKKMKAVEKAHDAALSQLHHQLETGSLLKAQQQILAGNRGNYMKEITKFRQVARQVRRVDNNPMVLEIQVAGAALDMTSEWFSRLQRSAKRDSDLQVFLGGERHSSPWRLMAHDELADAKITCFSPQEASEEQSSSHTSVDQTREEEENAKASAAILLFNIDERSRAIVPMTEVIELILRGRRCVLVVQDVPEDMCINGHLMDAQEVQDLNAGRTFLRDIAHRYGVPLCSEVPEAIGIVKTLLRRDNPILKGRIAPIQPLPPIATPPQERSTIP